MQQHLDDFLPMPSLSTVSLRQATFFLRFLSLIVVVSEPPSALLWVGSCSTVVVVVVDVVVAVVPRAVVVVCLAFIFVAYCFCPNPDTCAFEAENFLKTGQCS